MPKSLENQENAIHRFWDRFLAAVHKAGVKTPFDRWYVIRAEQYVKTLPDRRLKDHTKADVENYFQALGRDHKLQDWQFKQTVSAIRILFCEIVNADWAHSVDWDHWIHSARQLPNDHATVVRDYQPLSEKDPIPAHADSGLVLIRKTHRKVLDHLLHEIRRRDYSIRTEQAYEAWVSRFIAYHGNQDPALLGETHILSFLEHLAIQRKVAASTQNQAFNALIFFYNQVLQKPVNEMGDFVRAKRPKKLPVILTRPEVMGLINHLDGTFRLMAELLYGTGMRLMECVRLRVLDVDFGYSQIIVRNAKGKKDRVVPLPTSIAASLQQHMTQVQQVFEKDKQDGLGDTYLPDALSRKYPNAAREWKWQYVFPSGRLSIDPRTQKKRRHHIHENGLQKVIKKAGEKSGITKRVNCHALRHSFATHLLEARYDIRTVQELLGHADVSTTMIYTHVLNTPGVIVQSPLDF